MAIFHPQCLNVINETKSPHGFNVEMYQAFQLVKYQKLWKNFVVNPSQVSSLTEQLEPMVNSGSEILNIIDGDIIGGKMD